MDTNRHAISFISSSGTKVGRTYWSRFLQITIILFPVDLPPLIHFLRQFVYEPLLSTPHKTEVTYNFISGVTRCTVHRSVLSSYTVSRYCFDEVYARGFKMPIIAAAAGGIRRIICYVTFLSLNIAVSHWA